PSFVRPATAGFPGGRGADGGRIAGEGGAPPTFPGVPLALHPWLLTLAPPGPKNAFPDSLLIVKPGIIGPSSPCPALFPSRTPPAIPIPDHGGHRATSRGRRPNSMTRCPPRRGEKGKTM